MKHALFVGIVTFSVFVLGWLQIGAMMGALMSGSRFGYFLFILSMINLFALFLAFIFAVALSPDIKLFCTVLLNLLVCTLIIDVIAFAFIHSFQYGIPTLFYGAFDVVLIVVLSICLVRTIRAEKTP